MFCPQCGTSCPEGVNFCPSCGVLILVGGRAGLQSAPPCARGSGPRRISQRSRPLRSRREPKTPDIPESPEGFRLFIEEREYIGENWDRIRDAYQGRYIAVMGNSVVDSDLDFSALAGRVYERFGYKRIYMPWIGESRVYHIPSPRLMR